MSFGERLHRTLSDPLALGALLLNLIPIYAVLFLGWRAVPLVFLYWLENLVLGVAALARMTATAGRDSPAGYGQMVFAGPFFVVHFGMFCLVHGIFLALFARFRSDGADAMVAPTELLDIALSSGPGMIVFIALIALWQAAVFVIDYIGQKQYKRTTVQREMMAPYGHIVVLHLALILGGGLLMEIGEPMLGVLLLIMLRVVWGLVRDTYRLFRRESGADAQKS